MANHGQTEPNLYDKHINMFPPLRPRDSSHKLGSANTERHGLSTQNMVPAPYPVDDPMVGLTPAIPFTSRSSSSSLSLPLSALNFTDSNVDGGQLGTPVTINSNNGMDIFNSKPGGNIEDTRNSDNSNRYDLPFNFNSSKGGMNPSVANDISTNNATRISEAVAPPPYEESESRILQEKVYRTEEKAPIRPLEKRPVPTQNSNQSATSSITRTETNDSSSSKDKLSGYSPEALAFYQVYRKTIDDASKFTPEIQMKWCETLLAYAFKEDFISQYNINAEKLKRSLRPEEMLKNQKVILEHSFKVLTKLITLKWPPAMYLMGTLYSHQPYLPIKNKNIVIKNDEKALEYYCKAAKLNNSDACYRAGVCFEYQRGTSALDSSLTKEDCIRKAFKYYQQGAEVCSNSACMYKLGMSHLYGLNMQKNDVALAIKWFNGASQHGDSPQTLYELGKIYEFNVLPSEIQNILFANGIRRDPQLAIKYYHQCAKDFQYPLAQWKLGNCYEFGDLGLPIMAKKSICWYSKAAAAQPRGNPMAMLSLSGWYLTGAVKVLKPNNKEALNWALKSSKYSDGKLARTEFALGFYYEKGIGCDVDLNLAQQYYLKAARMGFKKAVDALQHLTN
ncbi:YDL203C [Saccharomyces arboricola H-6]|uniref:YDL203C n=1 Tax=Saccharomyces arboricola (strain H-6 / AS 2.3317 / CBS 10644) TaxID=1160507 RepID=J8PQL6_SACAR|nr:YDL203C [Saccharomyces arboricola H-6]